MCRIKTTLVLLALGTAATACATPPQNIAATSVSPFQYQTHTCDQLGFEARRVSTRSEELSKKLQDRTTLDALTVAGGLFLWPMLLLTGGDGPEAAEYARLKGERDAIEIAGAQKSCRL